MASSNGDSDIRPDRIQAREDQFRRDIRARRQSPVAKKSVDLTELDYVGAHLNLSKHEPWPSRLELSDSEASYSGPVPTSILLEIHSQARSGPGSSDTGGSSMFRACTLTGCGSYLPSHEYKEFQRQRLVNSPRRLSISTPVEPETQEEHDPSHRPEPHVSYPVSYTPSHCSRALTDREDRSAKDTEAVSPGPWSQLNQTVGKKGGVAKLVPYTNSCTL